MFLQEKPQILVGRWLVVSTGGKQEQQLSGYRSCDLKVRVIMSINVVAGWQDERGA
mgnify:CR=1 FL=1